MKYSDQGCYHTVRLSADDVATWAQKWPGYGTPRAVWAQFDKSAGNLIDCSENLGLPLADDMKTLAKKSQQQTQSITLARELAREHGAPHIALDTGTVLPDTRAARESNLLASIVYIARPNGKDWRRPRQ